MSGPRYRVTFGENEPRPEPTSKWLRPLIAIAGSVRELRRVAWPSRHSVRRHAVAVLVCLAAVGLVCALVALVVARL